ncbi:MAG: metalloregulator ArsR/SmtB family transcription factor [Gammaproteobacteria bacterium]|nr:metalloregulator ArsR/SmtB family transcription factor [Gammaproteobacteria bacterium]
MGSPNSEQQQALTVFSSAAELFSVLSTPIRLQVLNALCNAERSVNELVQIIGCSQPNLSQHLKVLYKAGLVAKRKEGVLVMYYIQSQSALAICRNVCTQIAIEMDDARGVPATERLIRT